MMTDNEPFEIQESRYVYEPIENLNGFIKDIYEYYRQGGYSSILEKTITSFVLKLMTHVISNVLLTTLYVFLILNGDDPLRMVREVHTVPNLFWLFSTISLLLSVWGVMQKFVHIQKMHNFFKDRLLILNDSDLTFFSWKDIVDRFLSSFHQYQINPQSCSHEEIDRRLLTSFDFMTLFFQDDVLRLKPAYGVYFWYNELIHWNIQRLIFDSESKKELKIKCMILIFVNIVCMPFFLFMTILQFVVQLIIQHYFSNTPTNNDGVVGCTWTLFATLRFRELREMPHVFEQSLKEKTKLTHALLQRFDKTYSYQPFLFNTISKCGQLIVASSLLITSVWLLMLAKSNHELETWFVSSLSVHGGLFAIFRLIQSQHQQQQQLNTDDITNQSSPIVRFPFENEVYQIEIRNSPTTNNNNKQKHLTPQELQNRLNDIKLKFRPLWYIFVGDVVSVILCPFILSRYVLPRCGETGEIVEFFKRVSWKDPSIGMTLHPKYYTSTRITTAKVPELNLVNEESIVQEQQPIIREPQVDDPLLLMNNSSILEYMTFENPFVNPCLKDNLRTIMENSIMDNNNDDDDGSDSNDDDIF